MKTLWLDFFPSTNTCLWISEADGALDKARKHKKRQLEDTLNLVLKKRKVIVIPYQPYTLIHPKGGKMGGYEPVKI